MQQDLFNDVNAPKLTAFKFKDLVDGHTSVVIALTKQQAETALSKTTSIAFKLIDSKPIEGNAFVLNNFILPF
jgi:hypothetical protein